jgi:hypothetical protein
MRIKEVKIPNKGAKIAIAEIVFLTVAKIVKCSYI